MSISKAQAKALAEGFLDSVGSSKDGLQPRETFSEIILLAGEFIEDCQTNLIKNKSISSGKLSESLVANEPTASGTALKIDVMMNFYGRFVNKGVKGIRSGKSNAGYSFRSEFPGSKMVKAIEKWIKKGHISTRSVKKYSGHGSHEIKQKTISAYDSAWLVARSIKLRGLKPTGFLDKAVLSTQKKVRERLGAALRIDVINSLQAT